MFLCADIIFDWIEHISEVYDHMGIRYKYSGALDTLPVLRLYFSDLRRSRLV